MTQERLDAIKARCEAATHGRRGYDDESCAIVVGDKCLFVEGSDATEADLEFELHSLDDCESLLAEVERLRAELDRVAPFLATHGFPGYSIGRKEGLPDGNL